jgi:hypothetical protein
MYFDGDGLKYIVIKGSLYLYRQLCKLKFTNSGTVCQALLRKTTFILSCRD